VFVQRRGPGWRSRDSDSVRAGRIGVPTPMWARFSATTHTASGAHLHNGFTGTFPGVKRPGRGVDNRTPSSAEVNARVELAFTPQLCLRGVL